MSDIEDGMDCEPPVINPYEVLGLECCATKDQIKMAYRKAALKHHPDKVPASEKSTAHTTFQRIAFAYAILSDPNRRARYDATGSTADSLLDAEDGFNWTEYYRAAFADAISADAIDMFAKTYKRSAEERDDLLAAFEKHEGKMDRVYQSVMLADVLEDDARFREMLEKAIEKGEVTAWKAYTGEGQKAMAARLRNARKERVEAMEYAKKLGVHDKLFGAPSNGKAKGNKDDDGEAGLATLIQSRHKDRSNAFLDALAAKYVAAPESSKSGKKGKRQKVKEEDEPDEDAFQAAAARLAKKKKAPEEPAAKTSKKSRR